MNRMSTAKGRNGKGKRAKSKVTGVKKKYNYSSDKGAKASAGRLRKK